ncbi:penicillin-binding transpeptidase domain-containing protein [Lentibacillus sp. N15]|uniref:penicillin-binding transpeptidase domain-containing protein n=1 Tax=Lentibacillus songyuanensis TaxID=3136161 RepID=UPI0031BB1991
MKRYVWLLLLVVALGACSNQETQEDIMDKFVAAWNDKDFAEMYTYISKETKEEIDKENFVKRYQTIYEAIKAENLTVEAVDVSEEDKDEKAPRPYKVTMNTIAGEVIFNGDASLVEEKTEEGDTWKVKWDSSFIFPKLDDGETIRVISEEPMRGEILDRNEQGLAINAAVDEVGIVPGKMDDDTIAEVSELIDVSKVEIETALDAEWVTDETFVPITKLKPGEDEMAEELVESAGVMTQKTTSRFYPLAEKAAHLTGYIREVNDEDLDELPSGEYGNGSVVGSSGLENIYEEKLHGTRGWKIYIPESGEIIAEKEKEDGEDVITTIDADFQKKMFKEMDGDSGAGVALHPKTGETLGLVSTPAYNPNYFVFGWPEGEFEKANDDPRSPFSAKFNKRYAPGSTIKPITASIALNNGSLKAGEKKTIEGRSWQPDASWGGYEVTRVSDRLTEVNLADALLTSDNIYFAQAALDTGKANFTEGLHKFGFEEKIPYEFPINKSKIANDGLDKDILLADTGYGQGQMLMSPVHLAAAFTSFLNDGDMLAPTLEYQEEPRAVWQEEVTPAEDTAIISEGLRRIVENEQGSAYNPVRENLTIAGKTGTAELKSSREEKNGKENGWFVAYDYEDEDLLIVMMIEDISNRGGSGYTVNKVKKLFD